MKQHNRILFVIVFLLTPPSSQLPAVAGEKLCPETSCGDYSSQTIRLPFCITTDVPLSNPSTCLQNSSYTVYCDDQSPLLQLPNDSGNYSIKFIDFYQQQISLTDPSGCLAKRLMSLNVSGSPFRIERYRVISLQRCPRSVYDTYHSSRKRIDCLRDDENYVVIFTLGLAGWHLPPFSYCEEISVVDVPLYEGDNYSMDDEFPTSFPLAWDMPGKCRNHKPSDNKWCERRDDGTYQLACQDGRRSWTTISIVITSISSVLAASLAISVACWCFCIKTRQAASSTAPENHVQIADGATVNPLQPHPPPPGRLVGLDQAIIDSYPSIVIGGSGRLINPDDDLCSICLVEYCPKETLKILPLCLHRFHADCIDQWLRAKAVCPICRTHPLSELHYPDIE